METYRCNSANRLRGKNSGCQALSAVQLWQGLQQQELKTVKKTADSHNIKDLVLKDDIFELTVTAIMFVSKRSQIVSQKMNAYFDVEKQTCWCPLVEYLCN